MFLIYPIILAVLVGLLLGGRPSNLGRVQLRWSAAIAAGMAIQVALFVEPVTARIGDLGPPIYIASSLLVLAAVIRNWRLPGLAILAVGAASNLAAILANGGYMPASPEALAALTRGDSEVYSNSAMMGSPMLAPLTDIFAMPAWVPFANIFSIGDVLIGIGVAITIVLGMLGKIGISHDVSSTTPGDRYRRLRPAVRGRTDPKAPHPAGLTAHGERPAFPVRCAVRTDILHRRSRPGQTRREAGTQSQGSAGLPQTARLPDPRCGSPSEVPNREGEPGALHHGPDAARVDGPQPGRWNQVVRGIPNAGVLVMDTKSTTATPTHRRDAGPASGHRW